MLSPELKEKSAQHSGQGQKETKATHNKIIPHESLRNHLIPLKSPETHHYQKKDDETLKRYKEPFLQLPGNNGKYTWQRYFNDSEFYDMRDTSRRANTGLELGFETSNGYLMVIDYDSPESFDDFLQLLNEHNIPTDTIIVKTGGNHGGYHLYYLTDERLDKNITKSFENASVEFLVNHYVLTPPSRVKDDYMIILDGEPRRLHEDPLIGSSEFFDYLSENIEKVSLENLKKLTEKLQENQQNNSDESNSSKAEVNNVKEDTPQEKLPSNLYSSYLVTSYLVTLSNSYGFVFDLSSDLLLWESLLNGSYENLYGCSLNLERSMSFKDIFERENHASCGLFKREDGSFVYKDFRTEKSFNIVEVFHAIKNNKKPEFLEDKESKRWTRALIEFLEWIESNSVETGFLVAFDNWRESFESELKLRENNFSKYIEKTLQVILNEFRERIRKGHNKAVLTKRYVANKLNWSMSDTSKAYIVNRCMNFLVFSGLLHKGDTINFTYTDSNGNERVGKTYKYSINFECSPGEVMRAFESLIKNGLANYQQFNKNNITSCYGFEVANTIFRGKAKNSIKGDGENVSSGDTKQLPNVVIKKHKEQQNNNDRTTNERYNSTIESTTNSESNNRRVHDPTG